MAGLPTTAACPDFAYVPDQSATAVRRLEALGAIVVGKTNLDQFATGLVGVRSPYGVPRNPFDPAYIPGGSSSGSAVAVAAGTVAFALGTDTAGSGRVPAAFNNLVGREADHRPREHRAAWCRRADRSIASRCLRSRSKTGCACCSERRGPTRTIRLARAARGICAHAAAAAAGFAFAVPAARDCASSAMASTSACSPRRSRAWRRSAESGATSLSSRSRARRAPLQRRRGRRARRRGRRFHARSSALGAAASPARSSSAAATYRAPTIARMRAPGGAAPRAMAALDGAAFPAGADRAHDLSHRRHRARSGRAQQQSRHLHQFREFARSGGDRDAERLHRGGPAVRRDLGRARLERAGARRLRRRVRPPVGLPLGATGLR